MGGDRSLLVQVRSHLSEQSLTVSLVSLCGRLRVLHVAPPARTARLHVRPHGPRARGGHHENGETGSESREILPTHWRRMFLSARLQPNAVLLVH